MHPFHSLFADEPATEYVPDAMGRLGEGAYVVKPDPEPIGTPDPRFDALREAERRGDTLGELFGDDPLRIKGPVGPIAPNRRADVAKVETFLDRTGDFDLAPTEGPTGYYGTLLQEGITRFQDANGLKRDGLLNPGGETIAALARRLKDQIGPIPPGPTAPLTSSDAASGAGRDAGQGSVPVHYHPGGGMPRTIVPGAPDPSGGPEPSGARPSRDTMEDFRKADRESMKGLETPKKPKPSHREAERSSEQSLTRKIEEEARAFLQRAKIVNRISKDAEPIRKIPPYQNVPRIRIDEAIKAFERYLDGKGGVVTYDPQWMLAHPKLRDAARRNEENYAGWISGRLVPRNPKQRIFDRLLALKDGEAIFSAKRFDGRYLFDSKNDRFSDHRLLLGDGFIKASGQFAFSRKGNIITIKGTVEQKISDPYDFTSGRSFSAFGERMSHDDLIWLERYGKAKVFEVHSVWRRKLVWRLRISRDQQTGSRRIEGIGLPRWRDFE